MDRRRLKNIVTVLNVRMRAMVVSKGVVYVEVVDDASGNKWISGNIVNNKFTPDFMLDTAQAKVAYSYLLNNVPILVREAV